jgi:thiosulfate reductase cytochrome b subunit
MKAQIIFDIFIWLMFACLICFVLIIVSRTGIGYIPHQKLDWNGILDKMTITLSFSGVVVSIFNRDTL